MNTTESSSSNPILPQTSVFAIMAKGRTALQNVKGLIGAIRTTFLVNYAIFALIIILLNGLLYFYALNPLVETLFGGEEGRFAWVGNLLLWVVQLTVGAIFALVALRLSIVLMSMWHENLVILVIQHFRPLPNRPFSTLAWLKTLGKTIASNLKQILFLLLLLLVGFLPGIGVILVFLLGAYLMGKDITLPYFNVLQEYKESPKALQKSLRFPTFTLGASQMLLALIPFVGWVLMPVVMIYQIIGLTYAIEEARTSSQSS